MRSKTILIVLHSIGESGQFESIGGFSANISTFNLNLSEKMEKIAWKNIWGHNTGQRHDRVILKIPLESQEQMQVILRDKASV